MSSIPCHLLEMSLLWLLSHLDSVNVVLEGSVKRDLFVEVAGGREEKQVVWLDTFFFSVKPNAELL